MRSVRGLAPNCEVMVSRIHGDAELPSPLQGDRTWKALCRHLRRDGSGGRMFLTCLEDGGGDVTVRVEAFAVSKVEEGEVWGLCEFFWSG